MIAATILPLAAGDTEYAVALAGMVAVDVLCDDMPLTHWNC
jgi:hypothetical protein